MRESERDELVEIMEQMGGLSHTAAAAAIAQGAAASSLASATLPGLIQREQTNVFQPLRFDSVMPPGKRAIHTETTVLPSRPGSAKRSPPRARPWSHSLGRRPHRAHLRRRLRRAVGADSRPPSAATRLPSARPRAAASGVAVRPPPRPRAQKGGGRAHVAVGLPAARRLLAAARRDVGRHFLSEEEEGSDAQGGPLGPPPGLRPVGPPRRRGPERHAPVGPSRRERLAALPALPPLLCRRAGARPRPPLRWAIGQGRRRPRDLYVLDVEATAWTLIEFCGVPPSARECVDRSRSARR